MVTNNSVNTNFNPNNTGRPLLQPKQPAFCANLSATVSNVTGDGTVYTILFDSVLKDQTSSYNNATGVFTAPVAGKYYFFATIHPGSSSPMNSMIVNLVATGITSQLCKINPVPLNVANTYTSSGGCLISMSASDTISCTIQISGGTKIASVLGSSSPVSFFGGYLVC